MWVLFAGGADPSQSFLHVHPAVPCPSPTALCPPQWLGHISASPRLQYHRRHGCVPARRPFPVSNRREARQGRNPLGNLWVLPVRQSSCVQQQCFIQCFQVPRDLPGLSLSLFSPVFLFVLFSLFLSRPRSLFLSISFFSSSPLFVCLSGFSSLPPCPPFFPVTFLSLAFPSPFSSVCAVSTRTFGHLEAYCSWDWCCFLQLLCTCVLKLPSLSFLDFLSLPLGIEEGMSPKRATIAHRGSRSLWGWESMGFTCT